MKSSKQIITWFIFIPLFTIQNCFKAAFQTDLLYCQLVYNVKTVQSDKEKNVKQREKSTPGTKVVTAEKPIIKNKTLGKMLLLNNYAFPRH